MRCKDLIPIDFNFVTSTAMIYDTYWQAAIIIQWESTGVQIFVTVTQYVWDGQTFQSRGHNGSFKMPFRYSLPNDYTISRDLVR